MRLFSILLHKEINQLLRSKTVLLLLLLASFIIGYGFSTAVALYSSQSIAATGDRLYAQGFEPVQGVFLPTYGGLFILFSLFLPLVIIPLVSREKEHNTLALLAQLPCSFVQIVIAKATAALLLIITTLLLTVPAALLWVAYGGHIAVNELLLLNAGYLFYGMFVVAVALFAAALFNNSANASVMAIFLIVISWIIDFGGETTSLGILQSIVNFTTTRMLKFFEQGIVAFKAVSYFCLIITLLLILTTILLQLDRRRRRWQIPLIIIISPVMLYYMSKPALNIDTTESCRNSFAPHIVKSLQPVPPIRISVYLRPADSRFKDYRKSFLNKLTLLRNNVTVKMITGSELAKHYGLFIYTINDRSEKTYSNSEEEIFPIIFKLAGINASPPVAEPLYPGYPLVIKSKMSLISFTYYLIIPLIVLLLYLIIQHKIYHRQNDLK